MEEATKNNYHYPFHMKFMQASRLQSLATRSRVSRNKNNFPDRIMTWSSDPSSKFHLPWDGYHILMNKIRDIAYRLRLNDNHAYITEKIGKTNQSRRAE